MNVAVRPRHGTTGGFAPVPVGVTRSSVEGVDVVGRASALLVVFLAGLLVLPRPAVIVVVVALVLEGWRVRGAASDRPAPTTSSVAFVVASVALWASAVAPFATQPLRRDGAVLLAIFAVLPLAACAGCWVPRHRHVGVVLWVASAAGASVAGVSGLVEVTVAGVRRADGMTGNAIVFGDLSLLMTMLTVALAPLARAAADAASDPVFGRAISRWRALTVTGVVLGIVAGVVSGSRGGWLAMPVMAAVLAIRYRRSLYARGVVRVGGALLAVTTVAVHLSGSMPINRARAAVAEVRAYDAATSPFDPAAGTSIGARFEAWRAALWATHEHLLTGVGWGNLRQQFGELAWARYRNPRIAQFDHAHQQLIGAAANSGLPGLVAWCAVLAVPGRYFWRSAWNSADAETSSLGVAGLLVVSSFLVFGLTEAIFENVVPVAFFAVVVALLMSQLDTPATARASKRWVDRRVAGAVGTQVTEE